MKSPTFPLFLIIYLVFSFSCDTPNKPKVLDWNKTANQQNFELEDLIRVEGVVYDPIGNPLKFKFDKDTGKSFWRQKGWESKTHTSVHNPHDSSDSDFNPNAPIGVVICTIYNPSAYEPLQRLNDMYSGNLEDYPVLEHKMSFTGTIYSFEKEFVQSYNDKPDYYLSCVRIHVTDITYISSRDWTKDIADKSETD